MVGSVLIWMVKYFMGGTIAENPPEVWSYTQAWFKECRSPETHDGHLQKGCLFAKKHCFAKQASSDFALLSALLSALQTSNSYYLPLQEHPEVGKKSKQLLTLKESMKKWGPFLNLHAKVAETKATYFPAIVLNSARLAIWLVRKT